MVAGKLLLTCLVKQLSYLEKQKSHFSARLVELKNKVNPKHSSITTNTWETLYYIITVNSELSSYNTACCNICIV